MSRNRAAAAICTINKIASISRLKVRPLLAYSYSISINEAHKRKQHSLAYSDDTENPHFQSTPDHFYTQNTRFRDFQQYPNPQNITNHRHHLTQTTNPQFLSTPNDFHSQDTISTQFQQNPVTNYQHHKEISEGLGLDSHTETSKFQGILEKLNGLCKEGDQREARQVLGLLEKTGIHLELPMFFPLMKAFGIPNFVKEAKVVHKHLITSVGSIGVDVENKILEMYIGCGAVSDAYEVFEKMTERNLMSWRTMIKGLAKNGCGEEAIDLFIRFEKSGMKPDGDLFNGVFFACSVIGDIDEGMYHFESMSKVYGISPSMDHYVSTVNMLGAAGYLNEAFEFIEKMPFDPSVEVWETLMNLCRVHGNKELDDYCAAVVEQIDPSRLTEQLRGGFLPMTASNTANEEKEKAYPLDAKRQSIELRAGDTSRPESYQVLKAMSAHMKEFGYVPETRVVLHDIDQEAREESVLAHSEKLAVACALLTTPARSSLRVMKNLRFCVDCHNAMKLISKIVGREFVIRDIKRFHHFRNGECTCNNYW